MWILKYVSKKPNATPKERLGMARIRLNLLVRRGYRAKIRRAKEGNRIVYRVYIEG